MYNTSSLYRAMTRAFTTTSTQTNFQEDFVAAVNFSLDELSFSAALTTAHTHITEWNSNISTLDAQDAYILRAGVLYHLLFAGWPHRAAANDPGMMTRVAYPAWRDAKGDYMVRQSRDEDQASSTQDDDGVSENDIIGLGYRGDE